MVNFDNLIKIYNFNLKKEISRQNKNKLTEGCFVYVAIDEEGKPEALRQSS